MCLAIFTIVLFFLLLKSHTKYAAHFYFRHTIYFPHQLFTFFVFWLFQCQLWPCQYWPPQFQNIYLSLHILSISLHKTDFNWFFVALFKHLNMHILSWLLIYLNVWITVEHHLAALKRYSSSTFSFLSYFWKLHLALIEVIIL